MHSQVYLLGPSVHLAPFLHGVLAHSSMSIWQRVPEKPGKTRGVLLCECMKVCVCVHVCAYKATVLLLFQILPAYNPGKKKNFSRTRGQKKKKSAF